MQIIIPYRDREENLKRFVEHYKGFDILLIEQNNHELFNRGKLCNIGFRESKAEIVCFHDVDMLAENLEPYHEKINGAVHFAGCPSQSNYTRCYPTYFGGVTLFTREAFEKTNGFPNDFWGWGGEDDDLYNRTQLAQIPVEFRDYRYLSLDHKRQPITKEHARNARLCNDTQSHWENNGLNTLEYDVLKRDTLFGVERILVNI